MDANNLHGSIHQGMAEAVENSYIVLFCMNDQYSKSEYCKKGDFSEIFHFYFCISLTMKYIAEALYTDKRHQHFIPCLLQSLYEPQGWLGMVIGDQLYIDFSSPDNFDKAFEELINEIQDNENRLQMSSSE
jgi:hypothetical protein